MLRSPEKDSDSVIFHGGVVVLKRTVIFLSIYSVVLRRTIALGEDEWLNVSNRLTIRRQE